MSRPLRPEPPARARGNNQAGAFDALLDAKPVETPPPPRPERPARAERRNDAASKDRTESRADHRAPDAEPQPTADPAKLANAPTMRQVRNGQLSNTDEPAATGAETKGEAVQTEAVAQIAAAFDAVVVEDEGDVTAPPAEGPDVPAVAAKPASEDSDDAPAPVADAKPAETAPVVVAVAVPVQAMPAPMIEPTVDADTAPVAAAPAQLAPADPATAEAAAVPVVAPADNKGKAPRFVAPEQADVGVDIEAASDAPKPAVKDIAAPAAPKPVEQKVEGDKPKPDQHASIKHAGPDAPAPVNNRPGAAEVSPEAPKPAHQPHAQPAEPAAPRGVSSEVRADAPPPQPAAAPSASVPGNAPIMPFGLALSPSLTATLPHAALRVDAAADNPVPLAGVAVEIVARTQDGLKRFDIRLDPPELGRIDVRLDVDHGGKVTSRLIVERAETLDLLRRDAPQLERALQQAGLNTGGGMQFSLRDQSFAGRDQFAGDGASASHLIVPEDDTAAADAARRGYGRLIGLGGGIDIRV